MNFGHAIGQKYDRRIFFRIETGNSRAVRGVVDDGRRGIFKNSELLSRTENIILQRLKGDILSDPDSPQTNVLPEFKERHLYKWSEDDSWISVDGFFNQENDIGFLDENREEQNMSRTTGGARIRGYL